MQRTRNYYRLEFINKRELAAAINRLHGDSLVGMALTSVNVEMVRNSVLNNVYVESGLIYTTVDGLVKINLVQRRPVLRVINFHGQHFFLASDGHMIPTSMVNSARVPLAHGIINERFNPAFDLKPARPLDDEIDASITVMQKLFLMGNYLKEDEFLQAFVEEIYVNQYGEFEITPKTADHTIIFGGIEDMEGKFDKLLVFYREALKEKGWKMYKTVNIKYKNQVVCTKNNISNP
jgi:cell division protein FtsQ